MRAWQAGNCRYAIGPARFVTGMAGVARRPMRACLAGNYRYAIGPARFDPAVIV